MELKELLAIAWKRRWLIVLVVGLAVGLSAVLAFSRPASYEATATLALTPDVRQGQGFVASDSISALLSTYAETAKAKVNLGRAARVLGRVLPGEVDTQTEPGSGILRVIGKASNPEDAALTARAAAQAFANSISGNQLVVATLVDPAEPPDSPVQPRPPLIIATALLLGLLTGLLVAFAVERLRGRVETPDDVAEITEAPILGRLPRHRTLQRAPARLIWDEERMVGLQEGFRALRTNLQFLVKDSDRLIQVTSPEPSQGKSTIVANLGVALSQVGIETVIVDADFRRPRQHQIFGLDNSEGLSMTMAMRDDEPLLKSTSFPNLWVLTSGPMPPEPTEMLAIRAAAVCEQLRKLNALVLIDSPPILPVNDARLIAPHTDGVLLVIAAKGPKPSAVRAALGRLQLVGTRIIGVVLNESGDDMDATGGYYYSREAAAPSESPLERA
jgi:capsular exopolysaccharide synthesis family protein